MILRSTGFPFPKHVTVLALATAIALSDGREVCAHENEVNANESSVAMPAHGRPIRYDKIAKSFSSKNLKEKKITLENKHDVYQMSERRTPRFLEPSSSSAPGCGGSSGTYHSSYLGCYKDKVNDRALPFEVNASSSRNERLGHTVLDCERECNNRGYRYFAREFRGQCFCGNKKEYEQHGLDSGCNCCGSNVGGGKMCVWENTEHPDSQLLNDIPPIVRPQVRPGGTNDAISHPHTHITTSSTNTDDREPISQSNTGSTKKPIGRFRIRLHWQNGYNWQGSRKERFWCMECKGGCSNGNSVYIETCSSSSRQKFIAINKTIRPSSNPDLCLTVNGYSGKRNPIKLRNCNGGKDQNFLELKASEKFELQPEANTARCLSQHHHPKQKEAVYPETCDKTRRFDTTYWTTF